MEPKLCRLFIVATRVTLRVTHVSQELLVLSSAPGFTPGFQWFRVARSLVLCVVFCRSLSVYPFTIGHCIVCLSSMYGFWWILWDIQTFLIAIMLFNYHEGEWIFHSTFVLRHIVCFVCRNQETVFTSSCHAFCVCSMIWGDNSCLCCWYWRNCWPSLLKLFS